MSSINSLIWLIPALPLLGFLLNIFVIRRERPAGYLASGLVLGSFVVALVAFATLAGLPAEERLLMSTGWIWIDAGGLRVPFGIMLDPLSAVMVLLITGVGALIHVYSIGYMHGDARATRYFAYLNLFVTMMLFLVMANNMLLLFLGWEGVGLCSFLLIGHWFERKVAGEAAVKAFVANRVGDAAFILAMLAIFSQFGTLNFFPVSFGDTIQEGFLNRIGEIQGLRVGPAWQDFALTTVISFLLLIGATGKSAQLPLFVWLPDAMAGPTPVSALIHAATMVTGGVYLMARTHDLFAASPATQSWVMAIGALTALIGGTAAVAQWDIKRVLAYSTISQLGFMVAACGMGAYGAAIFHLLTHGIFKALLFLAAGSVIHGTHDTQDMRRMGGLRRAMPTTYAVYLIGALALAGIFPLAGFWSKDEIIGHAWTSQHWFVFVMLFVTSLLTAFYMGRQVALVFFGEQRDRSYHAHESGRVMTVPLLVLGVGAAIGGAINLPGLHWLGSWLEPVLREEAEPFGLANWTIAILTTLAAAGLFYLGWRIYTRSAARVKIGGKDPAYRYSGEVWDGMEEAWYFDRVYDRSVVSGFKGLSRFLSRVFDPQGVDGVVTAVGRLVGGLGEGVRRAQSGYVRTYALMFTLGVVLVLGFLVFVR